MRVLWVYTDDAAPAISSLRGAVKIEEITQDNEPAVRVTLSDSSEYTVKKSRAQIVIQWE